MPLSLSFLFPSEWSSTVIQKTNAKRVRHSYKRIYTVLLIAVLSYWTTGCASMAQGPEHDPYERINRKIFAFNDFLDKWILKPVAKSYQFITPDFVDDGVSNFFDNLGDVGNTVNAALQGDMRQSGVSLSRFLVNTTLGLGGVIDVASRTNLPERNEDFGQTLATWGVDSGPYIVLPIFGSSTLRDVGGRVVDFALDPVNYVEDDTARIALNALDVVDTRADLLDAESLITGDRYVFIRELYLQRRASSVANGQLEDVFDDSFEDDF